MVKNISDKHRYLLEEVSHMCYIERMGQQEIADKLFISRSQISRLLQEARELGIVNISIHYAARRNYTMETQMKARFDLNDIRVMSNYQGLDADDRFYQMGANLITESIRPNTVVGITWGTSVAGVVRAIHPEKGAFIDVVQVMGSSMLDNQAIDAQELVRSLAKKYGGVPHYIPAPLVVSSDAAHKALKEDAQVARSLELASFSDLLLTGIGTLRDVMISQHPWLGYMTPESLAELKQKNAVGSICAHFFDADGCILDCSWNAHCMGITLDNIRRMDNIVAVARGTGKAEAILGALCGGFVNTLITDSDTCARILELVK